MTDSKKPDSRTDLDPALADDQDRGKGAVEQDRPEQDTQQELGNTSMQGQLGHRDQDPLLKSSDTDFPEAGGSPEHTGEPNQPKKRDVA